MGRALVALWCCAVVWSAGLAMPAAAAEPENADIRVLIDISGSMKQNDPRNLRRPALRMLVGLMQPGTKAGVWTFARYAAELVQPGEVDEAWKQQALAASEQINSPGLRTDIERVLARAIRDWEGAAVTHRRNLLLLTDGMVDVSKDPAENAASRARILEQLLPLIRAMNAKVHAVALSARADHDLLKTLANESGGWYQQVDSAEQLQRVFLKLFEQAGKPTAVPLKDNKFRIDNTIREATVLVFQPEGSPAPALTAPSGASFDRESAPANVTWHQDTGYELITIRDPEAGEWTLRADVDPDNRVMVVTDLKLHVSDLPARIAVGDVLPVTAYLSNDGHLITRRDFLDLVEVRAETLSDIGLAPQPLNDKGQKGDNKGGDGRYGMDLVEKQAQPELDLVVAAESATFLREQRHMLAVVEPGALTISADAAGAQAHFVLDDSVVRAGQASVGIWQQDADGSKRKLELIPEAAGRYAAALVDPGLPVYARVEGVSRLGNPVGSTYGPSYLPGNEPPPEPVPEPQVAQPAAPEPAVTPAPVTKPEPAVQPQPEPAAQEEPAAPVAEEESPGWLMPTLVFGGANVLLLIGGGVYWFLRRRRRAAQDDVALLDDEEDGALAADGGEDGDKEDTEKA